MCSIIACLAQVGVKRWMVNNIPDLCAPDQKDSFTCVQAQVFYATSIIWGLIGPARFFGPGKLYHPLVFITIVRDGESAKS